MFEILSGKFQSVFVQDTLSGRLKDISQYKKPIVLNKNRLKYLRNGRTKEEVYDDVSNWILKKFTGQRCTPLLVIFQNSVESMDATENMGSN